MIDLTKLVPRVIWINGPDQLAKCLDEQFTTDLHMIELDQWARTINIFYSFILVVEIKLLETQYMN